MVSSLRKFHTKFQLKKSTVGSSAVLPRRSLRDLTLNLFGISALRARLPQVRIISLAGSAREMWGVYRWVVESAREMWGFYSWMLKSAGSEFHDAVNDIGNIHQDWEIMKRVNGAPIQTLIVHPHNEDLIIRARHFVHEAELALGVKSHRLICVFACGDQLTRHFAFAHITLKNPMTVRFHTNHLYRICWNVEDCAHVEADEWKITVCEACGRKHHEDNCRFEAFCPLLVRGNRKTKGRD